MKKNYIGFSNDHSGSMGDLAKAAMKDYNANIAAIKNAAITNNQDTVAFVVACGMNAIGRGGDFIHRQVVNSSIHALQQKTDWPTPGDTPLYDSVGDLIEQLKATPDANSPDVSFLVFVTTDGAELCSKKYNATKLSNEIRTLQATDRWTFVFRVPKGYGAAIIRNLGLHEGNVQEWETTERGMEVSSINTVAAVDTFYAARSAGATSTNVFYANAADVKVTDVKAKLVDISTEVNLWAVLPEEDGIEIKPFTEKRLNSPLLKGAAFYQLTKTEARVQATKVICIRDKVSGRVYYGNAARQMIGIPLDRTIRLHPGDHGSYDIYIQSTSTNRKLYAGSTILYWAKVGVAFKPEDQPWLLNPVPPVPKAPVAPQATVAVTQVVSPQATSKPTAKPTKQAAKLSQAYQHAGSVYAGNNNVAHLSARASNQARGPGGKFVKRAA